MTAISWIQEWDSVVKIFTIKEEGIFWKKQGMLQAEVKGNKELLKI